MPRMWFETVRDWPHFVKSNWYLIQITAVERSSGVSAIRIQIIFLDGGQEGRRQEVVLPLPIRPDGLTARFFNSCGVEVAAGQRIRPKDAIGRIVRVRFDPSTNHPVDFRKPENAPDSKQHSSTGDAKSAPGQETS